MTDIVERLRASQGPWSMQAADEIERLRAALVLFIQTVNPPYPQSMALWQQHLKTATENAKAALTAAAEVGDNPNWADGLPMAKPETIEELRAAAAKVEEEKFEALRFAKNLKAATIERCAQVVKNYTMKSSAESREQTIDNLVAAIRKDKP